MSLPGDRLSRIDRVSQGRACLPLRRPLGRRGHEPGREPSIALNLREAAESLKIDETFQRALREIFLWGEEHEYITYGNSLVSFFQGNETCSRTSIVVTIVLPLICAKGKFQVWEA